VCSVGAWLTDDLKWTLPKPPAPPFATTTRWPGSVMSAMKSPVSAS